MSKDTKLCTETKRERIRKCRYDSCVQSCCLCFYYITFITSAVLIY